MFWWLSIETAWGGTGLSVDGPCPWKVGNPPTAQSQRLVSYTMVIFIKILVKNRSLLGCSRQGKTDHTTLKVSAPSSGPLSFS